MAKYIWGIFWIWVIISYPFRTAAGIYADVICGTLALFFCIAAFVKGKTTHPISKSDYTKNFFANLCLLLSFLYFDDNGFAFPSLPTFPQAVFPILALLQNGYSMSRRR